VDTLVEFRTVQKVGFADRGRAECLMQFVTQSQKQYGQKIWAAMDLNCDVIRKRFLAKKKTVSIMQVGMMLVLELSVRNRKECRLSSCEAQRYIFCSTVAYTACLRGKICKFTGVLC